MLILIIICSYVFISFTSIIKMESLQNASQVIISNPLPFMTQGFIEKYLFNQQYKDAKIEVNLHNDLPKTIIISFTTLDQAAAFIKQYNEKNIDAKINCKLQVSVYAPSLESELASLELTRSDRTKIPLRYEYHKMLDTVYQRTCKEPGLVFLDNEVIAKQNRAIGWLIKKIGTTLLKGQSIMNISLPVYIFDKRTLLQIIGFEFSLAPYMLTRAYYSYNTIEKLKWMTTYVISQLFLNPIQIKPFSPILGETLQLKIGDLNIYMEQTVSKPLTFNMYCFDDAGLYKVHGFISTIASTGANSCKAIRVGKYFVEFKDGSLYRIYLPPVYLKGLTVGKRLLNFKYDTLIVDVVNNFASLIKINPDEKGFFSGLLSKKQKSFPDTFMGDILKLSDLKVNNKEGYRHTKVKDATSYCKIQGEWTDHIMFDGVTYWKRSDYDIIDMYSMKFTLPSDSSFREDMNYFINDDEVNAQTAKETLEQIQRDDRKLRANYKEASK